MNDPKFLRAEKDKAREAFKNRGGRYLSGFEEFLKADEERRTLLKDAEEIRARQNTASKEVGKVKAAKDDVSAKRLMAEVVGLKSLYQDKLKLLANAEGAARAAALGLPNIPHHSVPVGKSESDNKIVRSGPKPKTLDFKPLDHAALGESLGILDFAMGAKLAGSRFSVLKGDGARLERIIGQFMIDLHTDRNGYGERWVPYIVRPEILEGTGQLPKFMSDLYLTGQGERAGEGAGYVLDDRFLIPTAEVPLTNLVREEILDASELPMKFTALTPCFRQEAGSYGKDVRGLIRNHQFDKVELVWITSPEDSMKALEKLTEDAEGVLRELGLPYRVIELCTADLGFAACKTYDLEVWFPGEGRYREISSCSNCGDFQARRMNARFRRGAKSSPEFVHTLNGSGVAVGRLFAAILENYQQQDGSVDIPKALRDHFGAERILSRK